MVPRASLLTLGVPHLFDQAGDEVRFRTLKHFALLIRLATEPGVYFSREYLMDLLWPTAGQLRGGHSLSQALTVIRKRIGSQHLRGARGEPIGLDEGVVDADVRRIGTCDLEIRGQFLHSFEVSGAPQFEHWKDEWRATLMPRIRDCLVLQMERRRRTGDFAAVERQALTLLQVDPLSDDAVRGLMQARAWAGDRMNALQVYDRFEARLALEMRAQPSADLARIARLLREGQRAAPVRTAAEVHEREERRFEPERLIGREPEFAQLRDAWLEVRRRVPRIVLLLGDPGVGKTTLANSFVSTCQMDGAVVVRAQAYDAERDLPFAVLAELVRQLTLQRAISAAPPGALSELSRMAPEILTVFPGVPKPVEWSAEVIPLRLADSFLKAVEAAAEESPLVLVVDDIHAADNASTAILHVVARKLPHTRLLLLLTARSNELRSATGPSALVADTTIRAIQTLDLEPLSPGAAETLVETITGIAAGQRGDIPVARILQAGNGNPLALALLTREWLAHGSSSLLTEIEALNTQPVANLGIPRAIGAVFERQLQRLDAPTRAALDLAALLGRRLAELAWYEVVGLSPAAAGEALSHLREEGLLRDVHGQLEFRNELIRAQAYYAVAGPARQHLHRKVGEALASRSQSDARSIQLEVAWHFLRGGDLERAVPAVLEGGQNALAVGAPYEVQKVVAALRMRELSPPIRHRARLLLAKALIDQSKADAALPVLEELCSSAASISASEIAEAARLRTAAIYLLNRETNGEYSHAAATALQAAKLTGDHDLLARALFEFARSGAEAGDEDRVREAQAQIENLLKSPSGKRIAMAWYASGYCDFFFYDLPKACVSVGKAIDLLETSTDVVALGLAYNALGVCQYYACDCKNGHSSLTLALDLAERIGDDYRVSNAASNLCSLHIITGAFDQAIRMGRLSMDVGKGIPNQPNLMSSYTNLAEAYMLSGERDKALRCLEGGKVWMEASRSWRARIDFQCESANFALMMGNTSLALELIESIEAIARGRELAVPEAGMFEKLRIFRAEHQSGGEETLSMAERARHRFRQRNLVYYLEALAVTAWLEKRHFGSYGKHTTEELNLFDSSGAYGLKAALTTQGFLG